MYARPTGRARQIRRVEVFVLPNQIIQSGAHPLLARSECAREWAVVSAPGPTRHQSPLQQRLLTLALVACSGGPPPYARQLAHAAPARDHCFAPLPGTRMSALIDFFKEKPLLLLLLAFGMAQNSPMGMLNAWYGFCTDHPILLCVLLYILYTMYKQSQPFPESGGRVQSIRTEEEWAKVKASERPFIVDFYATWCPPCRMAAPVFGELSLAHEGIDFYKVNVDEAKSIAVEVGISAMPTFKLFKKGVEVAEVKGFARARIEEMLK